jgi:transposase
MRIGIEIRQDITSADLRKKAKQETDGRVFVRMLAIANVMDGMKREDAAKQAGMTRSRLHIWITRYNENSIAGLRDKPKGHPPRRLTEIQEQEVRDLVIKGPDGSLVRWRCIDLKEEILKRFNVDYHENSISTKV